MAIQSEYPFTGPASQAGGALILATSIAAFAAFLVLLAGMIGLL